MGREKGAGMTRLHIKTTPRMNIVHVKEDNSKWVMFDSYRFQKYMIERFGEAEYKHALSNLGPDSQRNYPVSLSMVIKGERRS